MKKIIAIMMALVMMMLVAVPAFAANPNPITKDSDQISSVIVATTTDDTDATYSVEIPSSFIFNWDDTAKKDANYKVTSQLPIGASLTVTVTEDAINGNVMTSTVATGYELHYTLTGGTAETFREINNAEAPATAVEISIAQAEYDAAVPAVYEGAVTYTVAYTPAP